MSVGPPPRGGLGDLYARKNRPAREVAKLLGLSRNAVYIAKTRILARLRDKLGSPYQVQNLRGDPNRRLKAEG
ncbi:MAG: hypothetical protein V2A79_04085 [Planctomycetota bacterium]